jgi:hypothetical protein
MADLIIEDGTGKPDANTYASLQQARDFASARGIVVSDDDAVLTKQLIMAADFIGTYESKFNGRRSFPQNPQALSFPRDCVYMYGVEMPVAFMPKELIGAQVYAAQAIENGIDLFPTQDSANVTEETVGPLTTKYEIESWTASSLPIITGLEKILEPLFGNGGYLWRTVRA